MSASANANKCCLILVDVQKDFWTAIPQVQQSFPQFPQNVVELLDTCRNMQLPIIHVRAEYNDSSSKWIEQWKLLKGLDKYGPIVQDPEPFAVEQNNEKVIIKHTFDGFLETDLEKELKQMGISTVLVAGLVTGCCVYSTAAGAFMRGYKTCIVKDCCADRTQEKHDLTFNVFGAWYFETVNVAQVKDYVTAQTK